MAGYQAPSAVPKSNGQYEHATEDFNLDTKSMLDYSQAEQNERATSKGMGQGGQSATADMWHSKMQTAAQSRQQDQKKMKGASNGK